MPKPWPRPNGSLNKPNMQVSSRRKLAQVTVQLLERYPQAEVAQVVAAELKRRRATRQLPWLLKEMAAMWLTTKGELLTEVASARPLSTGMVRQIKDFLKTVTGADAVSWQMTVDPKLVGGWRAATPLFEIDASLRRKLANLEHYA